MSVFFIFGRQYDKLTAYTKTIRSHYEIIELIIILHKFKYFMETIRTQKLQNQRFIINVLAKYLPQSFRA